MTNRRVRDQVITALKHVIDPELGANIVDLGVIQGVDVSASRIAVDLRATSPSCPLGDYLIEATRTALEADLPGFVIEVRLLDWPRDVARGPSRRRHRLRLRRLYLVPGILCLLAGLWGGLLRLSWQLPLPVAHGNWITEHGTLMVSGFLGTLIGLERAVALGRPWGFFAPLLSGLGGLTVACGLLGPIAPLLFIAASFILTLVFAVFLRRAPTAPLAIMGLGAVAWLVANVLALFGWPVPRRVLWWGAFLILTIAGERLELNRRASSHRGGRVILALALVAFAAGLLIGLLSAPLGDRLAAAGLIVLAGWFLCFDVAWVSVRQERLPRYTACALLCGFVWLGLAATLTLFATPLQAGTLYDALVHALFLGFVIGMVFAHAPIVLPAVLGIPVVFRGFFYVPLGLLQVSLLARVGGDLYPSPAVVEWGGLLNAATLLLFFGSMIASVPNTSYGTAKRASEGN